MYTKALGSFVIALSLAAASSVSAIEPDEVVDFSDRATVGGTVGMVAGGAVGGYYCGPAGAAGGALVGYKLGDQSEKDMLALRDSVVKRSATKRLDLERALLRKYKDLPRSIERKGKDLLKKWGIAK